MLPRRTRAPRRIEIGTREPTYPVTAQDYYRRIYFEAIDLMMNTIDQQFDQPSFDTYAKMESLLIKTLNLQDKSEELKFMEKLYNDDVNISVLTAQMEILQGLLKDFDYSRTSHKRPLIMSRICGRLQEVVAYQRSDHRGLNFW